MLFVKLEPFVFNSSSAPFDVYCIASKLNYKYKIRNNRIGSENSWKARDLKKNLHDFQVDNVYFEMRMSHHWNFCSIGNYVSHHCILFYNWNIRFVCFHDFAILNCVLQFDRNIDFALVCFLNFNRFLDVGDSWNCGIEPCAAVKRLFFSTGMDWKYSARNALKASFNGTRMLRRWNRYARGKKNISSISSYFLISLCIFDAYDSTWHYFIYRFDKVTCQ